MVGVAGGLRFAQSLLAASALKAPHPVWGAVLVGLLIAPHGAALAQPKTAAQQKPQQQTEEITVTASRREEKLRDVPAAITALSGDTLFKIGASNFQSFASLVPGLSQRDFGNPGQGTIILRGLNTGPQQITNTAATYIGDTPFSASGFVSAGALLTPDPDIADIDRLEVLKGPQGTLYGANSLGGLIRIIPRGVDLNATSGMASAEGTTIDGGGSGYALHGAVNVPILPGVLGVRVNGVYRDAPGWATNVGTGTKDVNHSKIEGGRIAIKWQPSEQLKFNLSGIYQGIHNYGYNQEDEIQNTLTPRYGQYKYKQPLDFDGKLSYKLAEASASYDYGKFTFIETASYGDYRTHITNDYTDTYIALGKALLPTIVPANAIGVGDFSPNMAKFTNDFRIVSQRLSGFEFVAGAFYTNERNYYRTIVHAALPNGVNLPSPFNDIVRTFTTSKYEEVAGYGDVTYYITDDLDVTGGVRYASNNQYAQTGGFNGNLPAVTFYAPRAVANFLFTDNVATYLGTIRWRISDRISTYVRIADGYRPGGPQTNPTPPAGAQTRIDPDTTVNYEGGIKATWLGGKLITDVSVYHIDWTKIQLNTLFGGITLQANGGDATVDGFEAALTVLPTDSLRIAVSGGYTDAKISRIDPGVRTSVGANTGDSLPLTPKGTLALLADQTFNVGGGTNLDLGATLRYRSDMPSSYPGAALNPNIQLPAFTTLDLRGTLSFDRYRIQLRGENITNEHGLTSYVISKLTATQPVSANANTNRPRSVSLNVSVEF